METRAGSKRSFVGGDTSSSKRPDEGGITSKVKEVLKRYGDKFKEKMDLTSNVLAELLEKGIISKADKKTIQEMADPVRQNAELLLVLKDKCSSDQDWVTVCDIIIAAKGGSAMTQLGEDMKHMLTSSDEETDNPGQQLPKPQIAIMTANETEENVVNRYLKLGGSGRVWEGLKDYDWNRDPFLQEKKVGIKFDHDADTYQVFAIGKVTGVHVKCPRTGPGGARETTCALLQLATKKRWPLKVIFVVGCCGVSMNEDKKEKNWHGTVLLSDQLEDYFDTGKAEEGGIQTKSQPYLLSSEWLKRLSKKAIVKPNEEDTKYSNIPVEKVDKYLSGTLVMKSTETADRFRGGCAMVGIEMEGSGVCSTVKEWKSEVDVAVTVVKGISDYGGRDKKENAKSVVFGDETKREVDEEARQEIAAFHAITLVTRCVASAQDYLLSQQSD